MTSTSALAELRQNVLAGRFSRRAILRRGAALGLSAPLIAGLLAACGSTSTSSSSTSSSAASSSAATSASGAATATTTSASTSVAGASTPSEAAAASPAGASSSSSSSASSSTSGGARGDSGALNIVMAQAPTILNPALASGYKDWYAAQFALEPLADFDPDGNLYPVLAAELPSTANGGLAADGKSVTWKLHPGVVWSDGTPFSANDVKFTYDFVSDPKTAATTAGNYTAVDSIDVVDDNTVKVNFKQPTPGWMLAFCGIQGMIMPQHILKDYIGANAHNAPFNLKPIGTGPFIVNDFKPGDTISLTANDKYRVPNEPRFASVQVAGGSDPLTCARAVIVTGEADYAYGSSVPAALFDSMENGPHGKLVATPPLPGVERIAINETDPNKEVDGQKSHLGTPHPFQSILNVRKAYALAVPRDQIAKTVYGPRASAAVNVLNGPPKFVSKNTSWKYDLDAAGKLLDGEGWVKGSDGVRAKDGVKMNITYQTSVTPQRQQAQEILKDSFQKLGVNVTLKAIVASVFFSSGAANPDTYPHFYADLELYYIAPTAPFPLSYMAQFYGATSNIAQSENQWGGLNIARWQNKDYDAAYEACAVEMDEAKQAELFIKMNDLIVDQVAVVPEYTTKAYVPVGKTLGGFSYSPWTGDFATTGSWYRIKS